MTVRIGVGVSDDFDYAAAFDEAATAAREGLGGAECDLCMLFAGAPHLGNAEGVLSIVQSQLRPRVLLGCGAGGVVGGGREIEEGAGAVVWALAAPEAQIEPLALNTVPVEGGIALGGLPEDPADYGEAMLVLADPNSFAAEALLLHLNAERPAMPVLGGLASAASGGSAGLFLDGGVVDSGAVACSLSGIEILPCVSQGAAPVGPEMTVTGVEGNRIMQLASKPALERLREAIEELEPQERDLAAEGLLLGVVIDENQPDYERGDFLVRPIVGVDPESGALAFADRVRVGQTVRLHVRDAESASDDLREALEARADALGPAGAAGALLFTCNGRGAHMFAQPDHDAALLDEELRAPAGGFFCAGEIGPVGGRNFLHGFTATMAVFPRE
jgi:small ligand-binding sensory domain FIST